MAVSPLHRPYGNKQHGTGRLTLFLLTPPSFCLFVYLDFGRRHCVLICLVERVTQYKLNITLKTHNGHMLRVGICLEPTTTRLTSRPRPQGTDSLRRALPGMLSRCLMWLEHPQHRRQWLVKQPEAREALMGFVTLRPSLCLGSPTCKTAVIEKAGPLACTTPGSTVQAARCVSSAPWRAEVEGMIKPEPLLAPDTGMTDSAWSSKCTSGHAV